MRILFGVMSAVQPCETVAALCDALGTGHPILIHHDFTQQAKFVVERSNVSFVQDPVRTGWGTWGFTQGIQKLLETAMARKDWDFFQLLSPTCLPVRPLSELEEHLESTVADYLIDAVDVASEDRILMSHGWRAFAQEGLVRQRVLRRARRWYLGTGYPTANQAGLAFPTRSLTDAGGLAALKARAGLAITKAAKRGLGYPHIFSRTFPCHVGSNWFGASRRGCEHLFSSTVDGALLRYFKGIHMPDEMLYATVFRNSTLKGAPALHYVSRFNDSRPAWIGLGDLDEVLASGKYFARKFPEDVHSDVRLELAKRLCVKASLSVA